MISRVFVEWVDSGMSLDASVWQTKDDLNETIDGIKTCQTVGFLLKETKDWICLGQTICNDQFRGGYLIYKKNIVLMYGLSSDMKEAPIRRMLK